MKITALVENTTKTDLKVKHGLSLYIETAKHKILFDVGPDDTLFHNADRLGIDLSMVDTVIISHGHGDHGGGLESFLKINQTAKIYLQESAFEPYFAKVVIKVNIGLDKTLKTNPQFILLNGDHKIDDELNLFTVSDSQRCHSPANDTLYDKNGNDPFTHEQNLVITEDKTALIMGCGHCGIVNILSKAKEYNPVLCVGGYHLYNPTTKQTAPTSLLDEIAVEMKTYSGTEFYTCHCTGTKAFDYLSKQLPQLHYLSCGEVINL